MTARPGLQDGAPLLSVRGLRIAIDTDAGVIEPVGGVDLELRAGECLGLVGESGSGKTLTALAIPALLPAGARITGGQIRLRGEELTVASANRLRELRGRQIGFVFQEPGASLNPLLRISTQVGEGLQAHGLADRRLAWRRTLEMLERVGIRDPERVARQYPHQLSGGMRQRAVLAMALICSPDLLIADEPTTALDMTIQAQILELVDRLRRELGMAMLWISHDLRVVRRLADRVAVLYAGKVAEVAPAQELFTAPRHPYTRALLECLPGNAEPGTRLRTIDGAVPQPGHYPTGCRFRSRCPRAEPACEEDPPLRRLNDHVQVACHFPHDQCQ
jgi:oligopeptide/dipeptide ABC transporter ATP-binding protein